MLNIDSLGLLIWEMFALAASPRPSSLLLTRATWMLLNNHNLTDNLALSIGLASIAWFFNTVYFDEQRMLPLNKHVNLLTTTHGARAKLQHALSLGTNKELIKFIASGACLAIGVLLLDHYRLRGVPSRKEHQKHRDITMIIISPKEN